MIDKNVATIVGSNIKRIRNDRGILQKDLGDQLGLSENSGRGMICRIESGKADASIDKLIIIANYLQVPIIELLDGISGVERLLTNEISIKDVMSDEEINTINNIRKLDPIAKEKVDEYIADISGNPYNPDPVFEQIINNISKVVVAKIEKDNNNNLATGEQNGK